jgi:hypothetical protein
LGRKQSTDYVIDEDYNPAFVFTQYVGYLRRDPDIGGFLFWLSQANSCATFPNSTQSAVRSSLQRSTSGASTQS